MVLLSATVSTDLHGQDLAGKFLTPEQFGTRYLALVKKRYPKLQVKRQGALKFVFSGPPADGLKTFLNNAYREYRESPDNLTAILRHYVTVLPELGSAAEKQKRKERIVPIVRSAEYLAIVKKTMKKSPANIRSKPVFETVVPGLLLIYAFDLPRAITPVSERDLKRFKLNRTALRALAKANLQRLIGSRLKLGGKKGVFVADVDGVYESSLLALDHLWNRKRFPVKGDIIAYVPKRNLIIVTGSQEPEGRTIATGFAKDVYTKSARPLFARPLVRRKGRWELYR